jgi:hypothetical protein
VFDETSDETCDKTCDDGVSETPRRTQPVKKGIQWMVAGVSARLLSLLSCLVAQGTSNGVRCALVHASINSRPCNYS